jgi:DNA-binding LacI/PurR family transcriptional regulator
VEAGGFHAADGWGLGHAYDLSIAAYLVLAITTVSVPFRETGEMAALRLLDAIRRIPPRTVIR